MYCYDYPHPAVTVDVVALRIETGTLQVHLIERHEAPFKGSCALPGAFLAMEESLEQAAHRVLQEKGAIDGLHLRQLQAFSAPRRDPRERVVSVAFLAVMSPDHLQSGAGRWHATSALPKLAFDHAEIVAHALSTLPSAVSDSPLPFAFVPQTFTLADVQAVYETLGGAPLDKRNFQKKLRALHALQDTGHTRTEGAHRPARLYRRV